MAHPSNHRCSPVLLRFVLVLLSLFLVVYIVGLREDSYAQASCPSCDCDCLSDLPLGFSNSLYLDCGKNDPDLNEETRKDTIALLSEELSLHKSVSVDNLERNKALILGAMKTSSHYKKEAEKCNAGMETCEEAREKAQAALIEELKLSVLWEKRANEQGWKDERLYL